MDLHERLDHVHGEDPRLDYMHKLSAIAEAQPLTKRTPNITKEPAK